MARQFVSELSDGDTVDESYLLTDKQLRANRNAQLYLLAQLRDRTGQITGLLWNVDEEQLAHVVAGDHVQAKGKVQLFQGNLQIILSHIETLPSAVIDPELYLPESNPNAEQQLARLREILQGLGDVHLRTLMECFLEDDEIVEGLSGAPAGVRLHHAFQGGLLEHIVNVLETTLRVTDLYPKVNPDLLLAGVFLHDIGKLRELSFDSTFAYTDEGQLIGHLVIGIEMINEKLPLVKERTGEDFPQETLLRLKHMVLSHHGSYEFGSPKLPMTPEAIALHHLDNLDAKVNEFSSMIDGDPNTQSHWTPYSANMQRKLFKGGE